MAVTIKKHKNVTITAGKCPENVLFLLNALITVNRTFFRLYNVLLSLLKKKRLSNLQKNN